MSKDKGLGYLLDLDGEILAQEGGCWVKIEAKSLTGQPGSVRTVSGTA